MGTEIVEDKDFTTLKKVTKFRKKKMLFPQRMILMGSLCLTTLRAASSRLELRGMTDDTLKRMAKFNLPTLVMMINEIIIKDAAYEPNLELPHPSQVSEQIHSGILAI